MSGIRAAWAIVSPRCAAAVGQPCTGSTGRPCRTHAARHAAAPPAPASDDDDVKPRGCPCGGGALHYLCRRAPVRS